MLNPETLVREVALFSYSEYKNHTYPFLVEKNSYQENDTSYIRLTEWFQVTLVERKESEVILEQVENNKAEINLIMKKALENMDSLKQVNQELLSLSCDKVE